MIVQCSISFQTRDKNLVCRCCWYHQLFEHDLFTQLQHISMVFNLKPFYLTPYDNMTLKCVLLLGWIDKHISKKHLIKMICFIFMWCDKSDNQKVLTTNSNPNISNQQTCVTRVKQHRVLTIKHFTWGAQLNDIYKRIVAFY